MSESKAVVLLSGGIDSATCLAIAAREYDRVIPVHIHYGQQTAELEHEQAERQTYHIGGEYPGSVMEPMRVVDYEPVFNHFAGGVASDRDNFRAGDGSLEEEDGRSTGYVPMRNLHLIATAAGVADDRDADAIFHGAQGGDEAAYPDCRKEFMAPTERAVNKSLADGDSVDLRTPLIDLSKEDVIRKGDLLEVDWRYTYSCYEEVEDIENPEPCGDCPACIERNDAFNVAGVIDPIHMEETND